jgi:hypothetical protein
MVAFLVGYEVNLAEFKEDMVRRTVRTAVFHGEGKVGWFSLRSGNVGVYNLLCSDDLLCSALL